MLKKGKNPDPDPQGLDTKLRIQIRIRSKMFRIRNTGPNYIIQCEPVRDQVEYPALYGGGLNLLKDWRRTLFRNFCLVKIVLYVR